MWNLIAGPIVSAVSGFFADRAKIKQAKVEGQVRLLQSASDNVADWEALHAKGSQTSWKDEYVLILWSVPVVMAFLGFEEQVFQGFEALAAMPEWYSYTLVTIALASFGIRMKNFLSSKGKL